VLTGWCSTQRRSLQHIKQIFRLSSIKNFVCNTQKQSSRYSSRYLSVYRLLDLTVSALGKCTYPTLNAHALFFLLPALIPLSHRMFYCFLLYGNKRDLLKSLIQHAEVLVPSKLDHYCPSATVPSLLPLQDSGI